jgi:peroxiredoxin
MKTAALLLLFGLTATADPPYFSAPLRTEAERKPAPDFVLKDAAGKTVRLKNYRGKVVLLDFWATWYTGCKQEIPWFAEFQKTYGRQGLSVVGMSMDDSWNIVKPFLAEHPIPYRILLADKPAAESYNLSNMPDTFLIDRQGRIAASYTQGLVERGNVESNIKALLKLKN